VDREEREPGGAVYFAALARRGGKEYFGGPICWDPDAECEGVCQVCPRTGRPNLALLQWRDVDQVDDR
jgi:hypothetical protein